MLAAVIYHSDHLELSEQFDGVTGYEKERQESHLELCGFSICRAGPDRPKRTTVTRLLSYFAIGFS
jgi:hypothetical protein